MRFTFVSHFHWHIGALEKQGTTSRCEGYAGQARGENFVNWGAVRIWVAIILLLDASFGLWNHERFEKSLPKINIARIALFEAAAALILLIVHALF